MVDKALPILIVDDHNSMLRIIPNLLLGLGFSNMDQTTEGAGALQLMRGKKYNLVISDWNMEPMTGLDLLKEVRADGDLLKEVRADGDLKSTPFIMVTAESKMENVVAAKQAGVNNYIIKPFNAAILKSKMKAVLGDF